MVVPISDYWLADDNSDADSDDEGDTRRILHTKPGTHMQTKCAYVWTELRTCAASSGNGSRTIHHEPKFVSFLREHNGNCVHQEAPGVLCSPQVHRKLIYHVPSANGLVRT